MKRRLAAAGVALLSIGLIVAGVALIYPPAALIVAGAGIGSALFIDVDPARRAGR